MIHTRAIIIIIIEWNNNFLKTLKYDIGEHIHIATDFFRLRNTMNLNQNDMRLTYSKSSHRCSIKTKGKQALTPLDKCQIKLPFR